MFELIAVPILVIAAVLMIVLARHSQAADARATRAESEAALSWGKGYRAGTDEQNAKLGRESKTSYDKGIESGWNACIDEYETRPTETTRTA